MFDLQPLFAKLQTFAELSPRSTAICTADVLVNIFLEDTASRLREKTTKPAVHIATLFACVSGNEIFSSKVAA
jgi:hypothetical protein